MQFILAIDQGTTGTTVSLYDRNGQVVAKADKDFPQIFPKPGWVAHNPEDIWESVTSSTQQVLAQAKIKGNEIAGIGITNQRETVLIWERATGKPIDNAIVWQCRRTTE